jgi:hypothetical protein
MQRAASREQWLQLQWQQAVVACNGGLSTVSMAKATITATKGVRGIDFLVHQTHGGSLQVGSLV